MTSTAAATDTPAIVINEDIEVNASIEATFNSLLVQLGRQNETPDGKPLPMILEAKPGGRWYRDLGGDDGHLWAFVQSIKRPVLLEFWGPLFISTGAVSNLTYRLTEDGTRTRIDFKHTLSGPVPDAFREQMGPGWSALHERIKRDAESPKE
jgi:hypothetical protein